MKNSLCEGDKCVLDSAKRGNLGCRRHSLFPRYNDDVDIDDDDHVDVVDDNCVDVDDDCSDVDVDNDDDDDDPAKRGDPGCWRPRLFPR